MKIDLTDNEAATSAALVSFANQDLQTPLLVVGTAKDAFVQPRTCRNGYISVYKFINDGKGLELLHKVSILLTLGQDETFIPYTI